MILNKYFSEHTGTGVIATADKKGNVNTAIYAKPHIFDDSTVGFIMRDRLTRQNLLENGHASYLFYQHGTSYKGLRLKVKLLSESTDQELITRLSRRSNGPGDATATEPRFLLKFSVEKCLSLIGGKEVDFQ